MKFISLFAGIGGFDLALTRQGHECVWANEWDKYAAQIYDKNFKSGESLQGTEWGGIQPTRVESDIEVGGDSQSETWGDRKFQQPENSNGIDTRDIRTVPTTEIPDHDLLVGGFPCQAFSIAGKRKGFDDTRGTLFFEIARILREKHTRLFILENVKGLLSHDNGNTFKTIISTLDELGYDLQWQVLNSKNFGVPQNRERVFIVGHLRGTSRPEVFPIRQDDNPLTKKNGYQSSESSISGTLTATDAKMHLDGTYINQLNQPKHSNDRIYGTDGISPTLNTMQGGNRQPKIVPMKWVRTEEGKEARRNARKELGKDYTPFNGVYRRLEPSENKNEIGCLTSALNKDALLGDSVTIRRLTPTECERLQGFPDNWTAGVSDTQRYKMCGNAVTVNVISYLVSKL